MHDAVAKGTTCPSCCVRLHIKHETCNTTYICANLLVHPDIQSQASLLSLQLCYRPDVLQVLTPASCLLILPCPFSLPCPFGLPCPCMLLPLPNLVQTKHAHFLKLRSFLSACCKLLHMCHRQGVVCACRQVLLVSAVHDADAAVLHLLRSHVCSCHA